MLDKLEKIIWKYSLTEDSGLKNLVTGSVWNVIDYYGRDIGNAYMNYLLKHFNKFMGEPMKIINSIVHTASKDEMKQLLNIYRKIDCDVNYVNNLILQSYDKDEDNRKQILIMLNYYSNRKVAEIFASNIVQHNVVKTAPKRLLNQEVKKTINAYQDSYALNDIAESLVFAACDFMTIADVDIILANMAKKLREERVFEIIHKYEENSDCLRPLYTCLWKEQKADKILNLLEISKDKPDQNAFSMVSYWLTSRDYKTAALAIDVFIKYKDMPEIAKMIKESKASLNPIKPVEMHTLLNDSVYDKIKNATFRANTAYDYLQQGYGVFYEGINDNEVLERISNKQLNKIKPVYKLIMDIHNNRNYIQKRKIKEGFFNEMNRVIAQAEDYDSKLKNIMQYCREVRQKIRERADEIMVIHNA